jgi:hypothetical protein
MKTRDGKKYQKYARARKAKTQMEKEIAQM